MGFATEDIKNSATLSEGEKAELKRIENEKIAAEVRRQLMEMEENKNDIPLRSDGEPIGYTTGTDLSYEGVSGLIGLPGKSGYGDHPWNIGPIEEQYGIDPEQELNRLLGEEIVASDPESFPIVNGSLNPNIQTWGPGISGFDGEKINYGNRERVTSLGDKGVGAEVGRKPIISEETGELGDGFQLSNAGSTLHMPRIEDLKLHKNETIQVLNQQPQKKWFGMNTFTDKRERFGFFMFMLPITLMSIVSMIHLVDFFKIGTSPTTAWMLGAAFELASLSTIVALVLLRKISRIALISVFFLLYALQMVGNIYSPFATINPQEASRLFDFFGFQTESISSQRWVAIIQGSILPTVNLLLFKLTSNYLRSEK